MWGMRFSAWDRLGDMPQCVIRRNQRGPTMTFLAQTLPSTLAEIDLFAQTSKSVLQEIVDAGSVIDTPAGRVVAAQGSSDAGLYVVLEGSADVDVNGSP